MIGSGGFGGTLASVAEVSAWLTRRAERESAVETVPVALAVGRSLKTDVAATDDVPVASRADRDGVAVRSVDTAGAGLYNRLRLTGKEAPPVESGDPLPAGFDAVVPWEAAVAEAESVVLSAPVAAGENVSQRGADWRAGALLAARDERLSSAAIGLLIAAGVETVEVRTRPTVRLIRAGRFPGPDANGPMLGSLVARDGGTAEPGLAEDGAVLRQMLTAVSEDVVIVYGASGRGRRDFAAPALADAGTLAWHGVATEPGASFGAGTMGDATVLLLPGAPWPCFAAYELFAGPLLRRLAGSPAAFPHPVVRLPLGAKLVSPLGLTELRAVAVDDGSAYPLPPGRHAPRPSTTGFVQVDQGSEGFGAGEWIEIRLLIGQPQTEWKPVSRRS